MDCSDPDDQIANDGIHAEFGSGSTAIEIKLCNDCNIYNNEGRGVNILRKNYGALSTGGRPHIIIEECKIHDNDGGGILFEAEHKSLKATLRKNSIFNTIDRTNTRGVEIYLYSILPCQNQSYLLLQIQIESMTCLVMEFMCVGSL
jgi:hypothetical protein